MSSVIDPIPAQPVVNRSLSPDLLRLLRCLFFQPSAWRTYLAQIDPVLSPLFSLAELTSTQWRNPLIWRLLWTGFVAWPLLLALGFTLWMAGTGVMAPLVYAGLGVGLSMGIMLGMAIGLATGLAVAMMSSVVFALAWAKPDILLTDMMFTPRFAWIFGVTSATVLHIVQNLSQNQPLQRSVPLARQRTTGFTVGVVGGTVAFVTIVGGIVVVTQGREANRVADVVPGLFFSGIPSLLLGLIVGWRVRSLGRGLVAGMAIFLVLVSLFWNFSSEFGRNSNNAVLLLSYSLIIVTAYLLLFCVPFVAVQRIIGMRAGAITGAVGGLAIYFATKWIVDFYTLWLNLYWASALVVLGLTMHWWRPLLTYPLEAGWGLLLYRMAVQGSRRDLIPYHAAFWDELQYLPLPGLTDHLVLATERDRPAGQTAIDIVSISRQRQAAQAAQIELDARQLARCTTIQAVAAAHESLAAGLLAGPASAILRTLSKLSQDAAAALAQRSRFSQRLVLTGLETDLNGLLLELTRSSERYALRFRPIVTSWRDTVAMAVAEIESTMAELREIANPYVVGVPLTRQQEIFVGRTDISRRIEGILRDQDHPPMLLYGQRRMGKTSLLYQLRWMLPQRILPILVDLQGPLALSANHASFLYNLARGMQSAASQQGVALPKLTLEELAADPFTLFDDWLDRFEKAALQQDRSTILLALDEFEALDDSIRKERMDEDAVLGTLRHIIQHRPRFKLMLAGSHRLREFRRWSSYLINTQTIHLSYLDEAEARQLIERPMADFALAYEPAASRRVLDLTRGHPYLVQLLCAEVVMHKNEQPRTQRYVATVADVEKLIPEVLMRGQEFFADIEFNQLNDEERVQLRRLAHATNLADDTDISIEEHLLPRLLGRELIEKVNGLYHFQVELIRRWFAQEGTK